MAEWEEWVPLAGEQRGFQLRRLATVGPCERYEVRCDGAALVVVIPFGTRSLPMRLIEMARERVRMIQAAAASMWSTWEAL
jgi:hypothetical protein